MSASEKLSELADSVGKHSFAEPAAIAEVGSETLHYGWTEEGCRKQTLGLEAMA